MIFFPSSFLIQNWRIGGLNRSCLGALYQWEGEEVRKEDRRVNMVQILCTLVCKQKNNTRNGGGDKGEWWRSLFKYDIFDTL
jgi:hypothetical protein